MHMLNKESRELQDPIVIDTFIRIIIYPNGFVAQIR